FWRALMAAGAVGALAWSLPLWDALVPDGSHNLQQLFYFFTHTAPLNPSRSTTAFAYYAIAPFSPALQLAVGGAFHATNAPVLRLVAAIQAAAPVAVWCGWTIRRRTFEAAFSLLLIAALGGAYLSVRRLPELPADYTVFWVSILGTLAWAIEIGFVIDSL